MNLLLPLTPVLKRRAALVLGTGLLTGLTIGGVAAGAQAGTAPDHGRSITAVAVALPPTKAILGTAKADGTAKAGDVVKAAGTATADLPRCSDLGASADKIRVTPGRATKALPNDVVGPGTKVRAKKGTAIKVAAGRATVVRVDGKSVKAVVAIPACSFAPKGR